MSKFYLFLWLKWAARVTVCSVFMAILVSFFITLFLYIKQGLPSFNNEIVSALLQIFKFWFSIVWSLTLLISLFRSLKYLFNNCLAGYELKLLSCDKKEIIEDIGYGDLIKVWRKWFMLIIWLVAAEMVLAIVFTYVFTSYDGIFEWFNIYFLFIEVLVAGYFSLILLGGKCKQVKVVKC